MKPAFVRLALLGLVLMAAGAASAEVKVTYVHPESFSDLPFTPWKREQALEDISDHFKELGKTLPPGQDLSIEVLDVDLAGRERPSRFLGEDVRIMRGEADWPRMHLRYTLSQNGKLIKSGDAQLSDMGYMDHLNLYPSTERLPYEMQMMDDWFKKTFGVDRYSKR
jgi:uncharacterized lipoprotein YbaY